MRFIKNWKFLLLVIVFFAAFLRFYQLGSNPPSLTWDEAAWGYNAYSIGIDGKDEFGRFLPHDYLESFGDFKPPMYAYLDVFPVKIFGLNEFSTRFPSAFFGTLTVLFSYFLVKRIFYKSKQKEYYAILTAFILAISPWHFMLSRAAFEANVASFFIVVGIWSFLAGVQDKKRYLIISAIFFSLSLYTFNTARVVSPLLVLLLAFSFRKKLFEIRRETILALVVGAILVLPTFKFLLSPQAGLRFKEVNIFSDISVVEKANQEIVNDRNSPWSKVIHNRRLLYSVEYIKHYFDNLRPNFLFIQGDGNPKFSIQTVGQMYIWDIVFFIAGILFLFKKKEDYWWIIPVWLIIGIIPAGTARETPHALRIETVLPTFQIFIAYGFIQLINLVKTYKKPTTLFFLFLLFLNFSYFYHDYLTHYSYDFSGEWQYGYKKSINYVKSVEAKYDYIQVTDALGRPYIYYLFYTKTNPDFFRKTAEIKRDAFGFVTVESFGKYVFVARAFDKDKKVLHIGTPYDVSKNTLLKTFYLLNGEPVLSAHD